ncbi:hypothetical protein AOLI_G00073550 [Acnodon oligacanthus]
MVPLPQTPLRCGGWRNVSTLTCSQLEVQTSIAQERRLQILPRPSRGVIGKDLGVLQASFDANMLPQSCQHADLSLLPKKGDLCLLKNWQPVLLLCTDHKIRSRRVADRLKKELDSIVPLEYLDTAPVEDCRSKMVDFPELVVRLEWEGWQDGQGKLLSLGTPALGNFSGLNTRPEPSPELAVVPPESQHGRWIRQHSLWCGPQEQLWRLFDRAQRKTPLTGLPSRQPDLAGMLLHREREVGFNIVASELLNFLSYITWKDCLFGSTAISESFEMT